LRLVVCDFERAAEAANMAKLATLAMLLLVLPLPVAAVDEE
jgi:hypothetical protein